VDNFSPNLCGKILNMTLRQYLTDLEISRTFFHIFSLIIFYFLYSYFLLKQTFLVFLAFLLASLFFLEFQKRENGSFGKIYISLGKPFFRQSEKGKKWVGAITVLLGCFFTALFFPKKIALTAILFLALGDPLSRILRVLTKRKTFWGKVNFGTLGMFLACFFIAKFISGFSLLASIFASFFASLAESFLEVKITGDFHLDDNFFVPLVGGIFLFLLT
jgi:dolichol kinase